MGMRNGSDNVSSVATGEMLQGGWLMGHTNQCAVTWYVIQIALPVYTMLKGYFKVLHVHPNSVLFTRKPRSGWVIFHEMEETKKTQ